jgi:hypothetical protein
VTTHKLISINTLKAGDIILSDGPINGAGRYEVTHVTLDKSGIYYRCVNLATGFVSNRSAVLDNALWIEA